MPRPALSLAPVSSSAAPTAVAQLRAAADRPRLASPTAAAGGPSFSPAPAPPQGDGGSADGTGSQSRTPKGLGRTQATVLTSERSVATRRRSSTRTGAAGGRQRRGSRISNPASVGSVRRQERETTPDDVAATEERERQLTEDEAQRELEYCFSLMQAVAARGELSAARAPRRHNCGSEMPLPQGAPAEWGFRTEQDITVLLGRGMRPRPPRTPHRPAGRPPSPSRAAPGWARSALTLCAAFAAAGLGRRPASRRVSPRPAQPRSPPGSPTEPSLGAFFAACRSLRGEMNARFGNIMGVLGNRLLAAEAAASGARSPGASSTRTIQPADLRRAARSTPPPIAVAPPRPLAGVWQGSPPPLDAACAACDAGGAPPAEDPAPRAASALTPPPSQKAPARAESRLTLQPAPSLTPGTPYLGDFSVATAAVPAVLANSGWGMHPTEPVAISGAGGGAGPAPMLSPGPEPGLGLDSRRSQRPRDPPAPRAARPATPQSAADGPSAAAPLPQRKGSAAGRGGGGASGLCGECGNESAALRSTGRS
eukprot:TRINITY_DN14384_c0_g2_i1.p2 TRINITY_DN14384_c0_g2~~TRINITY_DN14384_c0_g2_i1.p2  ORF type:complete len:558 (+),score=99.81 TRINITY_DN14384_c0_g2_i1:60-1676(+)